MQADASDKGDIRQRGLILALIVSALLCLYTLTFNGIFRVDDEHILAARAQSLAIWGEFSEPQVYGNQRVQSLAPLGDQATQIEPGQTVLGAGLYRIASKLNLGGAQALFSLNIYLTAFTAGIVYLIALSLGYQTIAAASCALLFGAGSMAWPYATTYFRDTLAMLMSGMAFLGWVLLRKGRVRVRILGAVLLTLGISGGIVTKNSVAALLPAFFLSAGIFWMKTIKVRKKDGKDLVWVFFAFVAVIILITLIPKTGPLARFSLDYYRFLVDHFIESLNSDFPASVLGPFLSPAKSIFLFSPSLVLVLMGLRKGIKSHPGHTLAALLFPFLLAAGQAMFYRERWAGTFGWGLRYMLPALPALYPLASPFIETVLQEKKHQERAVFLSILILSVIIQVSGSIVAWQEPYLEWGSMGLDPYAPSVVWKLRFLSIPAHIQRLFRPQTWSLAWIQEPQTSSGLSVMVPLTAVIFGGIILWMLRRQIQFAPRSRNVGFFLFIVVVLSTLLPSVPLWWGVRGDPRWGGDRPEFSQALESVENKALPGDVMVVDSYGTRLWAFWINQWNQPQHWYSLPFEIPSAEGEVREPSLSEGALWVYESIGEKVDRLWYISSDDAPDYGVGGKQRWLEEYYEMELKEVLQGDGVVEVMLFNLKGE